MTLKCIIIDDEPIARKLLQEYIEETDFLTLVGSAENPLKAAGLISEFEPDLIFLDVNMPKMNGRETLQHIRNNRKWRHIPVAIFTTSANKDDIEFCKSFGSACITKPMSYADFSDTLQKLFNQMIPPVRRGGEEVGSKK